MSKYDALVGFLARQKLNEICHGFSQIETVLGFDPPPSARKYHAWWTNNHSEGRHCMSWMDNGWETTGLDLGNEQVTFVRKEL